jgi:hypothetical protein
VTHQVFDPQLVWEQMIEAHAAGDGMTVDERSIELLDWLKRGGFPPKPLVRRGLRPHADRLIVLATCTILLDRSQQPRMP